MNVGAKIREIRKLKKITMKQLGAKVGVTEQAIGQYERNQRTPTPQKLKKIAEGLEVPIDIFFDEEILDEMIEKSTEPITFESLEEYVQENMPQNNAIMEFLLNPNTEKAFKYSYKEIMETKYREILVGNIEKCINKTVKEIKENALKKSIYVEGFGWVHQDDPMYNELLKINEKRDRMVKKLIEEVEKNSELE